MSERRTALALVGLGAAVKLLLAARWGLLADEAYYGAWAATPALGYFDHPPLTAWLLALMPHSELGLRLPGIALTTLGAALLVDSAQRPLRLAALLTVLPPLWLLGLLATPDAPLLGLWMIGLAAALRGGRWWLVVGVAWGLAVLAKYSGLALLPVLWLAARPEERRSPWLLGGAGLGVILVLPHAVWSMLSEHPALRFQAEHGLGGGFQPWGPLVVMAQQLALGVGLLTVAGALWLLRRPSAEHRMPWALSMTVTAVFTVASLFATPEANWLAIAWVGVAWGLAHSDGVVARLSVTGAWMALFASLALIAHVERPLLPLPVDPAARVFTGERLAHTTAKFVLPVGVEPHSPAAAEVWVLTERYQEAAWLRWHLGVATAVWQGCGRPNELDGRPQVTAAHFLRPQTGGPPDCVLDTFEATGRRSFEEHDGAGRSVGHWDIFELNRRESLEP